MLIKLSLIMKKSLLFGVFAALLSLAGCKGEDLPTTAYNWNMAVTNGTDKEIVIENSASFMYGAETVTIAPGKSGTVGGVLHMVRTDNTTPMPDTVEADDSLPFGAASAQLLPDGEYWLDMTVGGEAVSGKIWTRKHWSFASDNFSCTWSLTVTDEFLARLESPETEQ